jgi:HEAT repeat protein
MTKFIIAFVIVAGLAGSLVLQHNSLSQIRTDLAALKAGDVTASNAAAPEEAPEKRGLFGRAERPVTGAADNARIEQRLAAIEDAVNRLTKASEMLMERGQLPLSESKAAELRLKVLDASLPDNERLQALRLLRRNNEVTDEIAVGALAWMQSSTNSRVVASILDQFDGLKNPLLRGPLLQFASTSTDPGVRRQAIENLEHYAGDPAVDALLWKAVQSDADPAVRRQAENSLRNGPMTETRVADMRQRAMNPSASLDERLTAFQALTRAKTDVGDLATMMATTAQSTQDPQQRAQIFAAFDDMTNPALAPVLVNGLQDPNAEVRRRAADSLSGLSGDKAVADWLRYVAENDTDPRVRREAMQALGQGGNSQWRGRRPN